MYTTSTLMTPRLEAIMYTRGLLARIGLLLAYVIITTFLEWRRLRHLPEPPAAYSKWWMLRSMC